MLGRFEVLSREASPITFRTRKVSALLALLALNKGKSVSGHTLQELLWPESDGDRQSQNLRKAVSDLRDALDSDGDQASIIKVAAGGCSLDLRYVECDADRFEKLLTEGAQLNTDLRFAEAIALYGGPLLAPVEEDWVHAYRRQYEEMFCSAVLDHCWRLVEIGDAKSAIRIGGSAITLAPFREEGYVASIRAHAATGNHSAALLQLESLERMLDYNFGETPSTLAYDALEAVLPAAAVTRSGDNQHGGRSESPKVARRSAPPYYVKRKEDQSVLQSLEEGESVVLVFGPRQTGKTSLIARTSSELRSGGSKVATTDFQSLNQAEVDRVQTCYRALAFSFAKQLGFEFQPSWSEWTGPNSNLDDAIDRMLREFDRPVCWAMDEVDRLFGTDYSDDFFGLVRSWHNRRTLDPSGPWRHLSMLISYATEAHLFIRDLNQSPFNVGVRVSLRDFSAPQVEQLSHEMGFKDSKVAEELFEITRGHPFLTQRALKFLASGNKITDLVKNIHEGDCIFSDHLRRVVETATRDDETVSELQRMLRGEPFLARDTAHRLWSAGLIASADQEGAIFRVPMYEDCIRKHLGHS